MKFPAYLCILTKSQFSKQILKNVSNIKFYQKLSSESWDNICGQTNMGMPTGALSDLLKNV